MGNSKGPEKNIRGIDDFELTPFDCISTTLNSYKQLLKLGKTIIALT